VTTLAVRRPSRRRVVYHSTQIGELLLLLLLLLMAIDQTVNSPPVFLAIPSR